MHSLRARIPPFAFWNPRNDRAGWIDCNGCHECAVQTPSQLCIFSGLEGSNRQHVEAGSKSAARYPSGIFNFKALLLSTLTGCVGYRASWSCPANSCLVHFIHCMLCSRLLYVIIYVDPGLFYVKLISSGCRHLENNDCCIQHFNSMKERDKCNNDTSGLSIRWSSYKRILVECY